MDSDKKIRNLRIVEEVKPSLVPPWIAAIASLILPGLGQALARKVRRGLILFVSLVTVVGLLLWRLNLEAQLGLVPDTWGGIAAKAFRLNPILIFITIIIVVFYIWIVYDAYMVAKEPGKNPLFIFLLTIIVFLSLGFQIGEIDLVAVVRDADDALPALMRVLWPWEKAISYPETIQKGIVQVMSPCMDDPYPTGEHYEDGPYLIADPTCGEPTAKDNTPGTEFHVEGYGFNPGVEVEIWWQDPITNEFRQRQGGEYIKVMPDENGDFSVDIIMPYRLIPPSAGEGPKEWQIQGRQLTFVGKGELSTELKLAVEKMIETIIIGMMATLFGIIFAVPISFLAARNLMSASPITMGIYYIVRAILNMIRSIEPLIWAIIAVIVVGLGPFAGILALTLHSLAALAKLYSESIESIDPGPIEAVQATGANWLQTIMFAVVPQIIPPFVSFTIYRWDINIRMSTIIGFVGGGGIGFLLAQWIRLLDYRAAGIAVWFIAISVAILDYVSAEIRARFV
ncbi:MAG: phosphonate ABC transporter, permease protein PhnE [Anaerolineaceae bacterium]|nr:phosphonate ABC transporter, permease protein PhnE [Anaerolineaceae bacterium]